MITIGESALPAASHAVVTGMPHPNEPTGTLAALALAELLTTDEVLLHQLGLIWNIIPCIDPDGAALNYGWYAGPFTRRHYAEHIYRPPFPEQYEWTFSRPDSVPSGLSAIPESASVAAVIDRTRPALLISMHNGEGGGLYAYVTTDLPGLADSLESVASRTGLPIYRGVPEGNAAVFGPGLFHMQDSVEGMSSSISYAAPYGTVGMVIEPPMWIDDNTADETLSDKTHGEVHKEDLEGHSTLNALMNRWLSVLRTDHSLDETARGRALLEQSRGLELLLLDPGPETDAADQPCTVAFAKSVAEVLTMDRLRCTGHLLAYLRDEAEREPLSAAVRSVHDEAATALADWTEEDQQPKFVGLGPAVRGHVGLTLEIAYLLRGTVGRGRLQAS